MRKPAAITFLYVCLGAHVSRVGVQFSYLILEVIGCRICVFFPQPKRGFQKESSSALVIQSRSMPIPVRYDGHSCPKHLMSLPVSSLTDVSPEPRCSQLLHNIPWSRRDRKRKVLPQIRRRCSIYALPKGTSVNGNC